jgi:hypothetical protein
VSMQVAHLSGDSLAYGKARCSTIDTSAEEAMAWVWDSCSYERNFLHETLEGPFHRFPRRVTAYHSLSHREYVCLKRFKWPISPRAFANNQVWKREEDGSLIIAINPAASLPFELGSLSRKTIVEGHFWAMYRFSAIASNRCKVELIAKTNGRGAIPNGEANRHVGYSLNIVNIMRKFFKRDDEIDAANRQAFITNSLLRPQVYTVKEKSFLRGLFTLFSDRDDLKLNKIEFVSIADPSIKMSLGQEEGSYDAFLKAETVVDAHFLEAAAWDWNFMSREHLNEHSRSGKLDRDVSYQSEHYSVSYELAQPSFSGMKPRENVKHKIWELISKFFSLSLLSLSI